MSKYHSKAARFSFAPLWIKTLLLTVGCFFLSIVFSCVPANDAITKEVLTKISSILFLISFAFSVLATFLRIGYTDEKRIKNQVLRSLLYYRYGNPFCLKDGEYAPRIEVRKINSSKYIVKISTIIAAVDNIEKISKAISASLNRRFERFAVTLINTDIAQNYVEYTIEDVLIDKSLTFTDVNQMKPLSNTKLWIQKETFLDLTTSGSILCVGKTRSGKTTAIISILLQVLLLGRGKYKPKVLIIDPKGAELSQLPYVVSPDENGNAEAILEALKEFDATRKYHQNLLNLNSRLKGDVAYWWESFTPSFLFIDEYVACRALFPKKPPNKDSDYCLATFDNYIKSLITMGASAGCFLIISTAEASVEEAGIPSMVKNACTTKLLFKPTVTEGQLIWNSSKLKNFPERIYSAGDCWFSSTDGEHDDVSFCHFPHLEFAAYRELGRLLNEYYNCEKSADGGTPQDGASDKLNDSYSL